MTEDVRQRGDVACEDATGAAGELSSNGQTEAPTSTINDNMSDDGARPAADSDVGAGVGGDPDEDTVVTGKEDSYQFPIPLSHLISYLEVKAERQCDDQSVQAWDELLDRVDLSTFDGWSQVLDENLFWRSGIPVRRRRAVWGAVVELYRSQSKDASRCDHWLTEAATLLTSKDREQIDSDVPRTFVNHCRFAVLPSGDYPANSYLPALRNVLCAVIARNHEVGYWQGMAFIGAFLLLVFEGDEEQAFSALCLFLDCMFVSFFKTTGVRSATMILETVLLDQLPSLYGHFMGIGFPISTFATRWLICGFTTTLPSETCMRIWDVLFLTAAGQLVLNPFASAPELSRSLSGSTLDLLLLFSVALLRVNDAQLQRTTEASELKDVLHDATESLYDHEMVMQAAYHEILAVASRLEVDSDLNLMTPWTENFAWTQYLHDKRDSSEELLQSWENPAAAALSPKEPRKWTCK